MNASTVTTHHGAGRSTIALAGNAERSGFERSVLGAEWPLPDINIDTLLVAPRDARHIASWVAGGGKRVFILDGEDQSARKSINRDITALGKKIGEGGFHVAHELAVHADDGLKPTKWIALIAQRAGRDELAKSQWPTAKQEHEHNTLVTMAAPELLPRYAGIGVVTDPSAAGPDAPSAAKMRFASVWERKDATFTAIVDQGGLANGASLQEYRLTATDVASSMLQLSGAYQRLHDKGMAYTDPKDGNIAFSIVPPPLAAEPERASPANDASATSGLWDRMRVLFRRKQGSEKELEDLGDRRKTIIKDVVFIDAESMQRPGYATDIDSPVNRVFTPAWISKGVLESQWHGDAAWKRAQANEANDVFHMAAIGFGLVTGKCPQEDLAYERFQKKVAAENKPMSGPEIERQRADEVLLTRIEEGFAQDGKMLHAHAKVGLIPKELATALHDGLEGRIQTIADFRDRMGKALKAC